MFWAEKYEQQIKNRFKKEIEAGTTLIIRDEKTMSGRVHVGSLRGVAIHGVISEVLGEAGIKNKYLFEVNDFDPMDGLPVYVDQERYTPYMGRLLCDVPSPDDSAENYAEYWANEFKQVVNDVGYFPEFYRSSELYKRGKYNAVIKSALDHADRIRQIYKDVSGSEKEKNWLPIQVVCESCKKVGTTIAIAWDGEKVTYTCLKDQVTWAEGCGHNGVISPFDGNAKLPWKVEWPAKFKVLGVHIEGAGKDHSTKGGSRDIARHIVKEVFDYPEPVDIPYEFFVVGGKKMSSSKGEGSSAKSIADLLPAHMLRYLMMKEPKHVIDFEPYGDTIPVLYDRYDELTEQFFSKEDNDWTSIYPLIHVPKYRSAIKEAFHPRFSQIAYLVQMPHINLEHKVAEMKEGSLNAEDKRILEERAYYAKHWLELYSPEKFQFTIQETLPKEAKDFTTEQKQALKLIAEFMNANEGIQGEELHTKIHDIKKEHEIPPKDLFSAIYISILGKDSGPQAGWFLTALDRGFVIKRLLEASS